MHDGYFVESPTDIQEVPGLCGSTPAVASAGDDVEYDDEDEH